MDSILLHPCELSFLNSYKYAANAVNRMHFFANIPIEWPLFLEAWKLVLQTHERLRSYYVQNDYGQWRRETCNDYDTLLSDEVCFNMDLTSITEPTKQTIVCAATSNEWMRSVLETVSLGIAPLYKIALIKLPPLEHKHPADTNNGTKDNTRYLFLIILHHLLHDGWSNTILCEDLAKAYLQIRNKAQPVLRMPKSSYNAWCNVLNQYFLSGLRRDDKYWKSRLTPDNVLKFKPSGKAKGDGFWQRVQMEIDQEEVDILKQNLQARQLGTLSLITTTLLHLIGRTQGKFGGYIRFLHHGRKAADIPIPAAKRMNLDETVGLFFCATFERCSVSPSLPIWTQVQQVNSQLADLANCSMDWLMYSNTKEGKEFAKSVADSHIHVNYVPYGNQDASRSYFNKLFRGNRQMLEYVRFNGMPEANAGAKVRFFVFPVPPKGWNIVFEYNDAIYSRKEITAFANSYIYLLRKLFIENVNPTSCAL